MKKTLSFKAWDGNRYVGLAEILLIAGRFVLEFTWRVDFQEVAPSPEAFEVNSLDPQKRLMTLELLHSLTPSLQVIDGRLCGYDGLGKCRIVITAVDSTSWDVETDSPNIIDVLSAHYKSLLLFP